MKVTYVDHMGSDISVVNAARVSFNAMSEPIGSCFDNIPILNTRDEKLINYLAEHGHWSPFSHVVLTLRVKAPIFVARQLAKHQVGLAWNEISRRYVDYEPELYWPDKWRKKADNVKQGSSDEEVTTRRSLDGSTVEDISRCLVREAELVYKQIMDMGLAPEQARMILPQNMMITWVWTGTLLAWNHMIRERTASTTQRETQEFARMVE